MPNTPQNLIIHHSITPRDLDPNKTEASIERNHKERGFPLSSLGWHVGYQYMIFGNGEVRQYRKDTEEGAHCKEQSMNFKSIGICLIGDFDKETPSNKQIQSLKELMQHKLLSFGISSDKIFPHRKFAINSATGLPYKSCYGNKLPDDWAKQLINQGEHMILVEEKGTFYLEGELGYHGINGVEYLNMLRKITDKVEHRPPRGVQLGVVETAPLNQFLIKEK